MLLQINGDPRDVPEQLTVSGLLEFMKIKVERIAVEVNANVVPKSKHSQTVLNAGDQVEIVTFVGGG